MSKIKLIVKPKEESKTGGQRWKPPASSIPKEGLEGCESPVLYTPRSGNNIFHIPKVRGDIAYPACRQEMKLYTKPLVILERIRDPGICKMCDKQTPGDGYPENGPIEVQEA